MDPVKKIYLQGQRAAILKLSKTRMPPQNIRASELANCKRRTYYRLMGFIPAVSDSGISAARLNDFGRVGDVLHDDVRLWLRDGGAKISGVKFNKDGTQDETEFFKKTINWNDEEFNVSGRADGIIKIGNTKHVLEIKTLKAKKYNMLANVWRKTNSDVAVAAKMLEDFKSFPFQVHACMVGLDIKRAYVLPVDRDLCAIGLHSYGDIESILGGVTFQFTPALWKQVLGRCATIRKAVRTRTAPRPEFTMSSYDCGICPYQHLCHRVSANGPLHPQLGRKINVEDL